MIAVLRYQLALLMRSHRWIPPAVLYVLGVAGLGGSRQPYGAALAPSLSWSALMLVPAVAWLTRLMVTAEPPAARACAAAAGGPRRTHVAALLVPAAAGLAFGFTAICWDLWHAGPITSPPGGAIEVGATLTALLAGLLAALTCVLVGSTIGALGNPPLVRRPAAGMLGTAGAVVLALAWHDSPANAAVRAAGWPAPAGPSVPPSAVTEAAVLAALAWLVSAHAAARRGA